MTGLHRRYGLSIRLARTTIELVARIIVARRRQELGVVQQLLAHAVAALRERLRGEDAAVVLEVQLPDDDGAFCVLGFLFWRHAQFAR